MHPPGRVSISPVAVAPPSGPPLALGFKLKCSALFHELAVQLDGREECPPGPRDWRTGMSRASFPSWATESISRSSPTPGTGGLAAAQQPNTPLFIFSMRHIDVSLFAGSASQWSRDPLIPFAGSGMCLSCAVTSVDFEHTKASGPLDQPDRHDSGAANATATATTLRRILATVQPTAQDAAVAAASTTASPAMGTGDDENRGKNSPAIFARVELDRDWNLVVDSALTGLQLAVCPTSVEELLSVANDFSTAFATANDRGGGSPVVRQPSDKSSLHSLAGSNRRRQALTQSQRNSFAQPTSFPIALMQKEIGLRMDGKPHTETTTNANAVAGRSNNQLNETPDSSFASPPVVLSRAAFALPSPLRSLQVFTAVKSCGLWFFPSEAPPVDKRRTQVPRHLSARSSAGGSYGVGQSSAMHASLDLTASLAVHAMDWRAAGIASKSQVLAAELALVAFQVSFSRFKYPELFALLDPVSAPPPLQNHRQTSGNGNTPSSSPTAQRKGQQRQPFSNVASPHDSSDANDDGRQYGFFQQCDGDDDEDDDGDGDGSPSRDHPSTSSSHEEPLAAGSAPSSYQQQALLSPVRGKVTYVLSLGPATEDSSSNGLLLNDADERGWVIDQQFDGRIEEVELIVHLDMRPIERAIYDCILPVVALASTTSGDGGVGVDPSEQQIAVVLDSSNDADQRLIAPQSVLGLLGTLPSIAELTAKLSLEGVSVYLVNDFYRQPATVARTLCHSVIVSASILPCLRMKATNANAIEAAEHLSEAQQALNRPGQGLACSHDQKHSSASLQSVRSTTNSTSHDDIATSPLLRIVQSLNLPSASAAVNAPAHDPPGT